MGKRDFRQTEDTQPNYPAHRETPDHRDDHGRPRLPMPGAPCPMPEPPVLLPVDLGPQPQPAGFRCPTCNGHSPLPEWILSRIAAARAHLGSLSGFSAKLDTRDYCNSCRPKLDHAELSRRGLVDLRDDPHSETPGASVRLNLSHPALREIQRVTIEVQHIPLLVKILAGAAGERLLDPAQEQLLARELHETGGLKIQGWYQGLMQLLVDSSEQRAEHSVEPRLINFGQVTADHPVRRRLRLINPEDRPVTFSLLGNVGPALAEPAAEHLLATPVAEMAFRFDLGAEEVQQPWYREWRLFEVPPRSTIELPLAAQLRRGVMAYPAEELQITTHYPAVSGGDPAPGSRFIVRLVLQGPPELVHES